MEDFKKQCEIKDQIIAVLRDRLDHQKEFNKLLWEYCERLREQTDPPVYENRRPIAAKSAHLMVIRN